MEVLDALELERAVVLGHSAGALTTVNLASNHPERIRGAILTGHGLTEDPAQAAYLAFLRSQYSIAFVRSFMLSSIYGDVEVPVLQMHGALDQSQDIDSARELSSRLADTRFVAVEGSDHHVHIEAPDPWVEAVTKFVASLSP